MIRVIIGFKKKNHANIDPAPRSLRSYAMTLCGFRGAEVLESVGDPSVVMLMVDWETAENYRDWESSVIRKQAFDAARPQLADEPRVTTYNFAPLTGWSCRGIEP